MKFIKKCSFGRDNSNGGCCHNVAGLCSSKCDQTIVVPVSDDYDEDHVFFVERNQIKSAVFSDVNGIFSIPITIAHDCDKCPIQNVDCRKNGLLIGSSDPNNAGNLKCWAAASEILMHFLLRDEL